MGERVGLKLSPDFSPALRVIAFCVCLSCQRCQRHCQKLLRSCIGNNLYTYISTLPKYDIMILDYANFPLRSAEGRASSHGPLDAPRGQALFDPNSIRPGPLPTPHCVDLLLPQTWSSIVWCSIPSIASRIQDFWILQVIDVVSRRVCS